MLWYVPSSVTLKDNIKLNADREKSYLIAKLQKWWINRTLTIEQLPVKDKIDLPREVTKHKSEWQFCDEYKERFVSRVKNQIELDCIDSAEKLLWLLRVTILGGSVIDIKISEWGVILERRRMCSFWQRSSPRGKYRKEDVSLEESESWCIWLTRTYDENKERDRTVWERPRKINLQSRKKTLSSSSPSWLSSRTT